MADLATLRQRLSEAEDALHRLLTGALEVEVNVEDFGEVKYQQSSINKLETYIARLKTDIAKKEMRPRRGPVFMKF